MSNTFETEGLRGEIRLEANAAVVTTEGEITVFTSPALRDSLRAVTDRKPDRIVLDLQGTRYVDSSGVATLVEVLQSVKRYQGKLILAGMTDRVRGVFEIARLDSLFPFADTVEEALKA